MNELKSTLSRTRSLLMQGAYEGSGHLIESAILRTEKLEELLSAQQKSMTSLHIKIKELTDKLNRWQERCLCVEHQLDSIARGDHGAS